MFTISIQNLQSRVPFCSCTERHVCADTPPPAGPPAREGKHKKKRPFFVRRTASASGNSRRRSSTVGQAGADKAGVCVGASGPPKKNAKKSEKRKKTKQNACGMYEKNMQIN